MNAVQYLGMVFWPGLLGWIPTPGHSVPTSGLNWHGPIENV
jgi:hypothetical protein